VVITHDIFSVYKVAHKVVMLEQGAIHFEGSPIQLQQSDDPVVRDFIERYALTKAARI
jgi:phospholipid/cholesterol/gamma-HCH transport system ATP-binding protein